jgi:hypothetical protein
LFLQGNLSRKAAIIHVFAGYHTKEAGSNFPQNVSSKVFFCPKKLCRSRKRDFCRPCGSRQGAAFIEGRKTRLNIAISAPGESFQDAGGAHRG